MSTSTQEISAKPVMETVNTARSAILSSTSTGWSVSVDGTDENRNHPHQNSCGNCCHLLAVRVRRRDGSRNGYRGTLRLAALHSRICRHHHHGGLLVQKYPGLTTHNLFSLIIRCQVLPGMQSDWSGIRRTCCVVAWIFSDKGIKDIGWELGC